MEFAASTHPSLQAMKLFTVYGSSARVAPLSGDTYSPTPYICEVEADRRTAVDRQPSS